MLLLTQITIKSDLPTHELSTAYPKPLREERIEMKVGEVSKKIRD